MRKTLAALVVIILSLGLACGDDDGSTNARTDAGPSTADAGPPAPLTLDDLCGEDGAFATLIGRALECNPELGIFLDGFPSAADVAARCMAQFDPLVTDGTVELGTADDLEACLAFITGADCDLLDLDVQGNPCRDLIVGTIAEDGGCEADEQCRGEAYCAKQDAATCGTCAATEAEFDNCFADNECAAGRCLGQQGDLPGMCIQPGSVGEICAVPGEDGCIGRLQCNDSTGLCQRRRVWAEGEACDDIATDCDIGRGELYCNTIAGKCERWLALGADCTAGFPACNLVRAETCDTGNSNKCVAPTEVARSAACKNSDGEVCMAGDYCTNPFDGGTCTKIPAPGDACVSANPNACAPNFLLVCVDDECQYEGTPTGTCTGG